MFVKIRFECDGKENYEIININQIVSINYKHDGYYVEMSNGKWYCLYTSDFEPIKAYLIKRNLMFKNDFL